jgi:hypothetical protein
VVEGEREKPKLDNSFACLRTKENGSLPNDVIAEDQEDDTVSQKEEYDLNPWTDEELARDPIRGYTHIGDSKI